MTKQEFAELTANMHEIAALVDRAAYILAPPCGENGAAAAYEVVNEVKIKLLPYLFRPYAEEPK